MRRSYPYFSSEKWKVDLELILKETIRDRRKLNIGDVDSIDANAINSMVKFYIVLEKIRDGLFLLSMDTRVRVIAKNDEQAFVPVWRREFVIEASKELEKESKKQIQSTLGEFVDDYFKTNPSAKSKAAFYLIL